MSKQTNLNRTSEYPIQGLPAELLHRPCDQKTLGFKTSDELPRLTDVIGQPRAFRGLELGSEVSGVGYNIFVLGVPDSGRTTLSRDYLKRKAASEPSPNDWCYVNNFTTPHQPIAIELPPGEGVKFREDIQQLVTRCKKEIENAFASEEYAREVEQTTISLKKVQEAEFNDLEKLAAENNFMIGRTTQGFVILPVMNGKPVKLEELENLTTEQIKQLEQKQAMLEEHVNLSLSKLRDLEQDTLSELQELNARTAEFVTKFQFQEIITKFQSHPSVASFIESIQKDIVTNIETFRIRKSDEHPNETNRNFLKHYDVNILVDNSALKGAPVVIENHPTYHNLLGRIEHEVVMGASRTDFTMIRPGALHRANGGYLILPARDVLNNPYAWEGLERTLREGSISIRELGTQLSLLSTTSLEPKPIPLKVKVVLIGTPLLYYLLRAHDEDFAKLFKVRSEFATSMDRTPDTEHEYAIFIKSVVDSNNLSPFDNTAVASIIEYGSRLVEDQNKLSTRFGKISDLIRESAYWSGKNQIPVVTSGSVDQAISEYIYRNNLAEERIREMITDGIFVIDVQGKAIGQINALSVLTLGDYSFGRPSRITASAHPGRGSIVDIERQAKLGGAIHTKGILILSGFLGNRYGKAAPLSISASITFEQSYDGVDGDSASTAELLTLLSAIGNIELRQDRAVTGSINQHGHIQAVGGINEKIEGFFAVCQSKGLTGEQGVVIPAANKRNLMLKADVIQAVSTGRFHVWPVDNIDQAIELLADLPAGVRDEEDRYPEGTFNRAVIDRLSEFSHVMKPEKGNTPKSDEQV